MIRISTQSEPKHTVVSIDGRVTESDLGEIQRVRRTLQGAVVLDLRGLDACAQGGIRLLRGWITSGAQLREATAFLQLVLNDPSPEQPGFNKTRQRNSP